MFGDPYKNQQSASHTLGEYVSDRTEKVGKAKDLENIRYIDISSIDNESNMIVGYTEYGTKERPSRAQQMVAQGDILISTVRPNLNNVAIVRDNYDNTVASTGFCVLKKNEEINEQFLFTLVRDQRFADYLSGLTTGASYPAVNNKAVLDFRIDMPSKDLQNRFADFVKHIDKLKFTIRESIKKLELCYQSLMKKYFD